MSAEVSHGRGGAGNINADDTKYVDGEVVRLGPVGSHGDGAYSTGRGGSGNIGDPGTTAPRRADKEVVPEAAVRLSSDNVDYHTGRGGAGNEYVASEHKKSTSADGSPAPAAQEAAEKEAKPPTSLADKLKHKIFGHFKK
ncbi:hypothetical protein SAPIO_CDS3700 [Scedosporium apiospermum]|uniref:Uncharacterized protein n=1 Tax=Pseudallescheria apiosperma TaxID=563466 RepID=A0A084GBE3_PSEDA|nr:uncharacterized protein SAPIO_CDS3700 [Scedosporium apiospermum]KEZ44655.1 hypothetical protein SAPIO_CDS3700 [Scedosporium apiospermum]